MIWKFPDGNLRGYLRTRALSFSREIQGSDSAHSGFPVGCDEIGMATLPRDV